MSYSSWVNCPECGEPNSDTLTICHKCHQPLESAFARSPSKSVEAEETVPKEAKKDGNLLAPSSVPSQTFDARYVRESGWIIFYKIIGWIFIIGGLIVFFALQADNKEEEAAIGATIFGCGIGCLISAHILHLLERGVHHLELNSKYLKSIAEGMNDKSK